jgi:hypothetical protein
MITSWAEIARFYADLRLEAMARLAREIESSRYSQGLFGWTSMQELCVSQHDVDPYFRALHIKISPLLNGKIEFKYIDTSIEKRRYTRVVPEAEAFQRLERIIKQLHWFY